MVFPLWLLRTHNGEAKIDIEGKLLGVEFDLLLVILLFILLIRCFALVNYALPLACRTVGPDLDFHKFNVDLQIRVIGIIVLNQILFPIGLGLVTIY